MCQLANQAIAIEPPPAVPLPEVVGVLVDAGALPVEVGVGTLALAYEDAWREQAGAAAAKGRTSRETIGRTNFMTFQTYVGGENSLAGS